MCIYIIYPDNALKICIIFTYSVCTDIDIL